MGPKKGRNKKPPVSAKIRRGPDESFGKGNPLPNSKLPLVSEDGEALWYEAEKYQIEENSKKIDKKKASKLVLEQIQELYDRSSIPTISKNRMLTKISKLWDLRRWDQMDSARGNKEKYRLKSKNSKVKEKFSDIKNNLFEVAKDDEVPDIEKPFLENQRTSRSGTIGGVDKKVTSKNLRKIKRIRNLEVQKKKEEDRKEKEYECSADGEDMDVIMGEVQIENVENESVDDSSDDGLYEPSGSKRKFKTKQEYKEEKQKKEKLTQLIETADRFNLSSYGVAHLSNAVLATEGLIGPNNNEGVIYRQKVDRIRKQTRVEKVEQSKGKVLTGLMFDERIDKSLTNKGFGENNSWKTSVEREEHCSCVGFPEEFYMGHVVPDGGSGKSLADSLVLFLEEREADTTQLTVLLSDGCPKMTGWDNGTHTYIERHFRRPMQRVFCITHHAEKPFEHLFHQYDGKTTGPDTWSGPLGQELKLDIWERDIVEFEPMSNPILLQTILEMPEDVMKTLNNDHRYLLEMAKAVTSGEVSPKWARMKAGHMSSARWLNTQARILRLYMSSATPSFQHRRLTNYIIMVYVPCVVSIRSHLNIRYGPVHLLQEVMLVQKHCTAEEKVVVHKIIQYNGYAAHHESVLFSLLGSDKKEERQFAVEKFKSIRKMKKKNYRRRLVRPFKPPVINFSAKSLVDLADLSVANTQPPLVEKLSEQELEVIIQQPYREDFPCSTWAVERAVQITTQSALISSDPVVRDGAAMNKIQARALNPLNNKKIWN